MDTRDAVSCRWLDSRRIFACALELTGNSIVDLLEHSRTEKVAGGE